MKSSIDRRNGEKKNTIFLKRIISLIVMLCLSIQCSAINAAADTTPSVEYSVHVQNKGWLDYVSDGATGGTTGEALQAEAIKIRINGMSGNIVYSTHIEDYGWTSPKASDDISGTTGKNLRIEGIRIYLMGKIARNYDVYYRAHISGFGWLGWTKNGGTAGSVGCSIPMEAIQIKLYPKNSGIKTSQSYIEYPALSCQAHVSNIGWQNAVKEGEIGGTTGRGLQMEALRIYCKDFFGGSGIKYRAHVENVGWQDWRTSGQTAGTTGKAQQIEAVEMKLAGNLAGYFDIYYRVHCEDYGWLGWACNGESAGTTGGNKQVEAIQIKLVNKGQGVDRGGTAYYDLTKNSNNSNTSWDNLVGKTLADINSTYYTDGNISAVSGYTGQCTWYAYGRFYEVNQIALKGAPHAKNWLSSNSKDKRVAVLYGAENIRSQCIAVRTSGKYGHVMYVEYVSYNSGKPEYIYYTECNVDGNGQYDAGKDCVLKKKTYAKFVSENKPAGYIVAK